MTWTAEEWQALHHVLSGEPQISRRLNDSAWRRKWTPYRRDFYSVFQTLWTRRLISKERNEALGTPALSRGSMRWGSYRLVQVAGQRVLLFKSDLHINTDGAGLPLRQLIAQILEDARPSLLLSVGTSGGVRVEDGLGDCLVTNAARFRLSDEFETASFNEQSFRSRWKPARRLLGKAERMLLPMVEFPLEPPTPHYPVGEIRPTAHTPRIKLVDAPILTTDFFEYGTTDNDLHRLGCCVEMDDAVVAMVAEQSGTPYGFIRNISDPVINAELPRPLQMAWAVVTYRRLGVYTSFNSAVATWALIAGAQAAPEESEAPAVELEPRPPPGSGGS